jgi:hypothetical protein
MLLLIILRSGLPNLLLRDYSLICFDSDYQVWLNLCAISIHISTSLTSLRLALRLASPRCHPFCETMPMAKMAHCEENWFCLAVPRPSIRLLKSSPTEWGGGLGLQCCQLHIIQGQDHLAWQRRIRQVGLVSCRRLSQDHSNIELRIAAWVETEYTKLIGFESWATPTIRIKLYQPRFQPGCAVGMADYRTISRSSRRPKEAKLEGIGEWQWWTSRTTSDVALSEF